MRSPWRDLLSYAEFLRASGNLYVEVTPEEIEKLVGQRPPISPPSRNPATPMPKPVKSTQRTPQREPIATQIDLVTASESIDLLAGEALPEAERCARMEEARKIVEACRKCELGKSRTQSVYSDGSRMAKIVFVGEAPGEEEDRRGVPFVGRAGQLLTKMIQAIGFKREEVFICNTLKCRPPGNRDPLPNEKEACRPYLLDQLRWVRPQMIVALGAHAATYLTGLEVSVGKMRGHWHSFNGIPVMVTYHPAFLLRSPGFKTKAWDDMQMLHARYNELNPDDRREIWQKS